MRLSVYKSLFLWFGVLCGSSVASGQEIPSQHVEIPVGTALFAPDTNTFTSLQLGGVKIVFTNSPPQLIIGSKEPRQKVALPDDFIHLSAARLAGPGTLVLTGMVSGDISKTVVIDTAHSRVNDSFLCYSPSISPDGLHVAFIKFYPPHGQVAPLDVRAVMNNLLKALRERVQSVALRTMTLELHVAKLQGRLEKSNPEERFQEFIVQLTNPPAALKLVEEYAVLARLLEILVSGWLDASQELFTHLAEDWGELCLLIPSLAVAGPVVDVSGGAGDLHRGHRSVHILTFADGNKLVYKPRSLTVDLHFAAVHEWLAQKDPTLLLNLPAVLARRTHGWCEYIAKGACTSEQEVERFYHKLGGLLALLHMLNSTDFHYENVIAAGENPTPIDLEAVLHPNLVDGPGDTPMDLLREIQGNSVIRVGLLPRRSFAVDGENEGIDISGMGGTTGQNLPSMSLTAEEAHTDEMRIVRRQVALVASSNLPNLNQSSVTPADYLESLVRGFRAASSVFAMYGDELLRNNGLLDAFGADRLRLVVRPTMMYAKVLQESLHPNLLRDAVDRDRLLERLWLGCVHSPLLQDFFPSEKRDLSEGVIPAFFFEPNGRSVWDSNDANLGSLLQTTALKTARTTIASFNEKEADKQEWWIRASVLCSQERGHVVTPILGEDHAMTAGPREFLSAVCKLADRIILSSQNKGEHVNWAGLTFFKDFWTCGPVGFDLYNGSAGISLFLGFAGAWTGEKRYSELAKRALHTAAVYTDQLNATSIAAPPMGAMFGQSGLIYCQLLLGFLWDDHDVIAQAARLSSQLVNRAEQIDDLSLGSGLAGLVLMTARLALRSEEPAHLIVLGAC